MLSELLFIIPGDIDQFKVLTSIKLLGCGWRCFNCNKGNNINLSLNVEQKNVDVPREIYNLVKISEIYINYLCILYNNLKYADNLSALCKQFMYNI